MENKEKHLKSCRHGGIGAWRMATDEIVAAAKRQWRRLDFYSFAAYFNYYTFSSILFSKQKQISPSHIHC